MAKDIPVSKLRKWAQLIDKLPESMKEEEISRDVIQEYIDLQCKYCDESMLVDSKYVQAICIDCYDKIEEFFEQVGEDFQWHGLEEKLAKLNCAECGDDLDESELESYKLDEKSTKRFCSLRCQDRGRVYALHDGNYDMCDRPYCLNIVDWDRPGTCRAAKTVDEDYQFCSEFCRNRHHECLEDDFICDTEEGPVLFPTPTVGVVPITKFISTKRKRDEDASAVDTK